MSDKARHHFIPKLILRRFASRSSGKKHWIWQAQRDDKPRELSIRDVAVSEYFYGKAETGVEDSLGEFETRLGATFQSIESGADPNVFDDDLDLFVRMMGVRTRAVREQLHELAHVPIRSLASKARTEAGAHALDQYFENNLSQDFERALEDRLSPAERRELARRPALRKALHAMLHERAKRMRPLMQHALGDVFDGIDTSAIARDGQIQGLQKMLDDAAAQPPIGVDEWHLIRAEPHTVLLGDACVLARPADSACGPFLANRSDWHELYCPIGSGLVLVGTKADETPTLDIPHINEASAQCATRFIFASRVTDTVRDCAQRIGENAALQEPGWGEALADRVLTEPIVSPRSGTRKT